MCGACENRCCEMDDSVEEGDGLIAQSCREKRQDIIWGPSPLAGGQVLHMLKALDAFEAECRAAEDMFETAGAAER